MFNTRSDMSYSGALATRGWLAADQHVESETDSDRAAETLIRQAQNGSRSAFEELARQYLPFLSREAAKYVPFADVDDIVQEALVKLYRSMRSYREEGKFRFWLKTLVTRTCLDYWRQRRRQDRTKGRVQNETPEVSLQQVSDLDLRHDLQQCLDSLSADDRMICVMAFLEEQSHRDIARLVGSSVTAVKVRCFRLRNRLQKWFIV